MLKQYKGYLGEFQYNDREFELKNNRYLRYIGTETDGSKIKIPAGVTKCDSMFSGCRSLVRTPEIPAGVTNCNYMFHNCTSLARTPEIPAGVTNCYGMFWGCRSLAQAPTIPEGITDCDYMFYGCSSLQNYSLDNATYRDKIYCRCPSVIQEIDSFIQKFKERNKLNA